jgi:hypothetical protein
MSDLDDLFENTAVVSSSRVARFAGISENEVRRWASALKVQKIGQAFCWQEDDVEALLKQLDELEKQEAEDEEDEDEDDDG